jgi:aminoglycoside phosphotransferase (APT) family kinase protein
MTSREVVRLRDSSICRKEADLYLLVRGSVPVPEVLHVEPSLVLRYVEGITFQELQACGDAEAIAQAARSAGEALAAIHRFAFERPGWIAPGPTVTDGIGPLPEFVEERLSRSRAPAELRERVGKRMRLAAADLQELQRDSHLAHGDFNGANLIVRREDGRWRVVAVIDWEFAVSSTPLMDIGNFLRHGDVPGFIEGYCEAGAVLPAGWRHLARLVDVAALAQLATQGRDDAIQMLAAIV